MGATLTINITPCLFMTRFSLWYILFLFIISFSFLCFCGSHLPVLVGQFMLQSFANSDGQMQHLERVSVGALLAKAKALSSQLHIQIIKIVRVSESV